MLTIVAGEKVVEFEGTAWSQTHMDLNGLYPETASWSGGDKSLLPEFYRDKAFANEDHVLFVPDFFETRDLHRRDMRINRSVLEQKINLVKWLLLFEEFPAQLVFNIKEDEPIDDSGESQNIQYDEFGKSNLINLVGHNKIAEVVPELRELAFHDRDDWIKSLAIEALGNIGTQRAGKALCDIVEEKNGNI